MGEVGDRTQGFRRMAARNKPAGIRSLVYGIGKGKVRIEGFSVSRHLRRFKNAHLGPKSVLFLFQQNRFKPL